MPLLLSEHARRFNVNNNIISAQMDYAGGVKFGIMLTEMHGTQEDTQGGHRAAGTSCKSRGHWVMSEAMMWLLLRGVWETLAMTLSLASSVLSSACRWACFAVRYPSGAKSSPMPNCYRTLSALVNIFRSIPFIILLV